MDRVVGNGARSVIRNLALFRTGCTTSADNNNDDQTNSNDNQTPAAEPDNGGLAPPSSSSSKRNFSSYDALSSTFTGIFSKRRRKQENSSSHLPNESSTRLDQLETDHSTQDLAIEPDDGDEKKEVHSASKQGTIQTKTDCPSNGRDHVIVSTTPIVSMTPVEKNDSRDRNRRTKRRKSPPLNSPTVSLPAVEVPRTIPDGKEVVEFPVGDRKAHSTPKKKTLSSSKDDEDQFVFTGGGADLCESRRTPQVRITNTRGVSVERSSAIKAPRKERTPPSVCRTEQTPSSVSSDVKSMTSTSSAQRRKKNGCRNSETAQDLGSPTDSTSDTTCLKKQRTDTISPSGDIADDESTNGEDRIETIGGSQTQVGNALNNPNGSVSKELEDESKVDVTSVDPIDDGSPHPRSDVELNNGGMSLRSEGTGTTPVKCHLKLPAELAPYNKPGSQEFEVVPTARLRGKRHEKQNDTCIDIGGQKLCKDMQDGNRTRIPSPTGSGTTRNSNSVAWSDYSSKEDVERGHCTSKSTKQHQALFRGLSGTYQCETIRFDGARCRYQAVGNSGYCSRHLSDEANADIPQVRRPFPPKVDQKPNATKVTENSGLSNSETIRRRDLIEGTNYRKNEGLSSKERNRASALHDYDVTEVGHVDSKAAKARSSSDEDASEAMSIEDVPRGIDSTAELSRCSSLKQRPPLMVCPAKGIPSFLSGKRDIQYLRELACLNDRCVFVRDRRRCESQCIRGSVFCAVHDGEGLSSPSADLGGTNGNDSSSPDTASTRPAKPFGASRILNETPQHTSSDESSCNSATHDSSDDDSDTSDTSDTSDDDTSNPFGPPSSRTYTHSEFLSMWHRCEELFGEATDEIESTKRVRAANQKMNPEDTDGQLKAQYGRLLPLGMKRMMEILELRKDDVFLDVGHGIGNTCLHTAFCIGCVSRGIEVVSGRHSIAEVFRDQLIAQNREANPPRDIGTIDLRLGRLEDPSHIEFLTKGVTKAYVNNFSGVFAERSSKNDQKWFLDHYVAGLFALLEPGAIMITFHPLNLGLDKEAANEHRKKHNLSESENSSFFTFEKLSLGKACKTVKWNIRSGNQNVIQVYKYTRIPQPHEGRAVFLCTNPQCPKARNAVPIEATMKNEEGRYVLAHCDCKFSPKNLRRQSKKVYGE